MKGRGIFVILFVAALAALTVFLLDRYADAFDFSSEGPRLVYLLILGLVIGSALIMGERIGLTGALKAIAVWVAIGLLLVLGYSYRQDLTRLWNRVAGEVSPSTGIEGRGYVRYRQSQDGHFYIAARANGQRVRFLVDTGATTTALDRGTAARAGINVGKLDFNVSVRTANGRVKAAPARLRRLEIGRFALTNVGVLVMNRTSGVAVLGMSTLRRFRRYDVQGGFLTLHR